MKTSFKLSYLNSLCRSVVVAIFALASGFVFAGHPICSSEIAGVSLSSSVSEVESIWRSAGLTDVTCTRTMRMSCEDRRKQGVEFASNANGSLLKVEDKVVGFGLHLNTGRSVGLTMKVRIDAPDTFIPYQTDRDWSQWSYQSLIESKIAEFCGEKTPDGVIVQCSYQHGVKIIVLAGPREASECAYTFEARYSGGLVDHAIFEKLYRR